MEENKLYPEGTVQQTEDFAIRQKIKKIVGENVENVIKEETIDAFKKLGYDEKDSYMFVVAAGGKDNKEKEVGKGTAEGKLVVTVSVPKMLNMGATKPVSYMQKVTTFGGKKIISEIYMEVKDKNVHIDYKNTEAASFHSSSDKDTYAPNKLNKSGVISGIDNEKSFKKDFKKFFQPIAQAEAQYLIGTKIGNDDKIEKNMNDSIIKENKHSMKLTDLFSSSFEDASKQIDKIVSESLSEMRFPSYVNQHVSFAVPLQYAKKALDILFSMDVYFERATSGNYEYFEFESLSDLGYAAEEVSKEVPLLYSTYKEKESNLNEMSLTDDDKFVVHGGYNVSNHGGYEIMLSDDGTAAKVRDAFGSDNPETSDWLEIEYIEDEDTGEHERVIDPKGYNIPLNLVMRLREGKNNKIKGAGTPDTHSGEPTEDDLIIGADMKIDEITTSGAGIGGPTEPSSFKYAAPGWSRDGKTPNLKANKDYIQVKMNESVKKTTYGMMRTPRPKLTRQSNGDYLFESGNSHNADDKYVVSVGNIGNIKCGSYEDAINTYDQYVEQSKSNVGRAGGESVTLFINGEIEKEHLGNVDLFESGDPYIEKVEMEPGWLNVPKGMNKPYVMGMHGVEVNSKKELSKTGHGNLNLLKETGEWDESDSEMQDWLESLRQEVEKIENAFPEKVELNSIRGFDKYQGPYANVKIGDRNYEIWTAENHPYLWIDNFPIDNTSNENSNPGFMGTAENIIEMLKGYFGELNESSKLSLIKRKFATLSENEEKGINKRYIITEKLSSEEQKNRWKKLYECDCFCGIKDDDNSVDRGEYEIGANKEFEANNPPLESDLCDTHFSGEKDGYIDVPKSKGSMVVFRLFESDVEKNKMYIVDHFTKKLVLNPLYKSK